MCNRHIGEYFRIIIVIDQIACRCSVVRMHCELLLLSGLYSKVAIIQFVR